MKENYIARWGGIPYFVLSVGHACTLKCKYCANICYSAKPEMKRYDLEDLKNDVKNILNCVKYIDEFQIQGGEPFIYSHLEELIEFLASHKKIKHITIATNGTIIPKDNLIDAIRKHDICIRISNYPITKEKGIKLQDKFDEMGIKYIIYNFAFGESEWAYMGGLEVPCENDDSIVSKRFCYCAFKGCLTLDNGELNWCSRISNVHALRGFKRRDDNHVDVRDTDNLYNRFWEFIYHKDFPEACRYCYGTYGSDRVIPGEQLIRTKK